MPEETLYWLLSTIAQAFGAILGVLGMLTVFKLQNLSDAKKNEATKIQEQIKPISGKPYGINPDKMIEVWKQTNKDEVRSGSVPIINEVISEMERINEIIFDIKFKFWIFLATHLFIVVICIAGLSVCPLLAGSSHIVWTTSLALILSVLTIVWLCKDLLKD